MGVTEGIVNIVFFPKSCFSCKNDGKSGKIEIAHYKKLTGLQFRWNASYNEFTRLIGSLRKKVKEGGKEKPKKH